ncbi:hypothetical protein [Sporosarcina sp. HYO08]|uniref:hypothetical protein n=1 Tax=Sporosarcina sp. HYO08 TaxID=1759557 RepID=UPI000792A770|nr:hypothetical protein [Sporosarcina sp. HYO08]KXH86104.1 hypothetical protein AU377_14650 [Sporosarcina sp. HYO08]
MLFGRRKKVSDIINQIKPINNNISIDKIGSGSRKRHKQLVDAKYAERLFLKKMAHSTEMEIDEEKTESSSSYSYR